MANDLAAVFVPIGFAGAGIAVACAIIVMVALARDAVGIAGGAMGVWFVGALLSVAASFAQEWLPLIVAGGALVAALVLGSLMRSLVRSLVPRRAVAAR